MNLTEVRIKLVNEPNERLLAFCSITIDHCFVIRDLKIIEGLNGHFVAMPSRKLTSHCPGCRYKNHLRANFCNDCGKRLPRDEAPIDRDGRAKLYADIAHPINSECRELIQSVVVNAYLHEQELAKDPNYQSRYDDAYESEQVPAPHIRPSMRSAPLPVAVTRMDGGSPGPARPPHRPSHQTPSESVTKSSDREGIREFGKGIFDE